MRRWMTAAIPLWLLVSCSQPGAEKPGRRAEIQEAGPATIKVVPAGGQLPFCLVFTASERGVVRHLTMTEEGVSIPCKAGEPIGGVTYRIPPQEGKVRVYVVFSDQAMKSSPIAAQIHELFTAGQQLTAMDLRAPGAVHLEALQFTPSLAGETIDVVGSAAPRPSAAP
ncbi:MAG: hypothetical protein IT372_15710 [Polyangiaceae bacterium]|nr:hypothetical protein [Polyangiaceae bacterium]